MKVDLHEGQVSGTLPLYVFLARSGKPFETSARSRSMTKERRISRARIHRRERFRGLRRVCRRRWRGEDTVLLLDRPFEFRRAGKRLFEILRNPCAGRRPGQERILPHALRQLRRGARLHCRRQRNRHPGRFRNSAGLFRSEEVAPLTVRTLCRPDRGIHGAVSESYAELFRRAQPMDFGIGYRGAPTNPICCYRCDCPTMVRPSRRRFLDRHATVQATAGARASPTGSDRSRSNRSSNGASASSGSAERSPAIASVNEAIQRSPKMQGGQRRWCAVPTTIG